MANNQPTSYLTYGLYGKDPFRKPIIVQLLEDSQALSHNLANGFYPEPDRSVHILLCCFLKIYFNVMLKFRTKSGIPRRLSHSDFSTKILWQYPISAMLVRCPACFILST